MAATITGDGRRGDVWYFGSPENLIETADYRVSKSRKSPLISGAAPINPEP
jgi:hypothetical protein